ncbi:hypothetical protein [Pseudomonas sp. RGM 3321]|uniref:hypothetical protein n=1 Tax=Pseudomonas sp. RGM 3321 TaxID=2930089 RepID=UPI001FCAE941|nr:hypothetical protein [Pseudomonas sp. RGM 3321]MCJ2370180.1 hypothetical protein [Pseudomonas sp. RGM 3321]
MKVVDLIDAVKGTGDIDKKFEYVVTTLATAATANTNGMLMLLDVLNKSPSFDKAALKKSLEMLRDEPPVSGDINGGLHSQMIDMFISSLS